MSMPITFTAPVAPESPAPAGAPATSGEPGALFGAVLSGISAGLADSDDPAEGDREESQDAIAAAGYAPLGGALLVGLNLPIGDGRTLTGATGPAAVPAPVPAATPTGGTVVPAALSATGLPAPGAAVPGQPAPSTQNTHVPSTMDTPAGPGASAGAPTAAPNGPVATVATVPPVAGAPVLPAAQAAAGAAAAAGLTGTLAGSVAGAVAGSVAGSAAGTGAPGTAPAPGAPRVAAAEPVARVVTGAPGDTSSTVDLGTGSAVGTAVRSRHGRGDTASGSDAGDGRLPRGPEAGWAPTLAAARADAAAPTTPAAPAPAGQPAPAPQLPPAAQLALRLAPLRAGPDGTHQLTILLNPEELGPVSVVATVKGDQLSVQLTGATETGRDALRAALPQLERDLRDGGFATLNLNVRETPQPDPRPAWAAPPQTAQPAQPTAPVAHVTPTATDFATDGTATTTTGTKTDSQPIGQVLQPDGSAPIRRDDGTGQYSAAGAVAATQQSSGAQSGGTGTGTNQQQATQLNLGQPGQSGQHGGQPGFAEQHANGGRHPGPAPDNGTGPQAGHTGPGEPDPPAAANRPGVRSVDLRV
jgi:flagellar hook-length control protein FliK